MIISQIRDLDAIYVGENWHMPINELATVTCIFTASSFSILQKRWNKSTMATLKVPTQTPSAAEDAEQLHKAFQGLFFFFLFHSYFVLDSMLH